MKKIKCLVTTFLILITFTGYSQIKDKETMLKKIFETLKNDDAEGFVKLFPDITTMKSFMNDIKMKDTSRQMDEVKDYLDDLNDSVFQQQFRRTFEKTKKKAVDKGIDLSSAQWTSFTADIDSVKDGQVKTTALKGMIYFTAGNKDYFIRYNDIIWFGDKGWYGVSIRNIDEKGKEHGPDISVDMGENEDAAVLMDSALVDPAVAADTIAMPVNEKPKAKSKTPVKNKPVQKKTQTPARKPN
jgi:hypothetical protein